MPNYDQKHLEILEKLRGKTVGAFIDDANLFYIQKKIGWKIDWLKVKNYLEKYFNIVFIRYYMGMPFSGESRFNNEKIKKGLEQIGFKVITKPLKKIYLDDRKEEFKNKCNCDVEIVFDIARNIDIIDIVIVMSGDSDFLEAKSFCLERKKSFLIMCFEKRAPWEFRRIHHIFFEDIQDFIKK